jgi:hypothetical protein
MKLDDRDIICQQDYAPLSNAELLTQIEENLEWLRGAALFDTERVMGPVRALLARAEAAEVVDLHRQLVEMATAMEEIEAERLSLAARVAELESQAAQGWRPLGAPPASTGEYLIGADYIPDVLLAEYHADTDMWYQQLPDGEWQLADWATHWRPLPPAPQERTP